MIGCINGKEVTFEKNETILAVARRSGHFIPTLCELASINHAPGTCRVCLAEIKRSGSEESRIVTTCNTPMEEGIQVFTRTRLVRERQRLQVELLLADHNQDCASCIRHGNCELQDVAQFVGLQTINYHYPKFYEKRSKEVETPTIQRDMTKCIRCLRCVDVCRKVQKTDILVFSGNGIKAEIGAKDSDSLFDSDCVSCGQCTLVCPVGALVARDDTEEVIDYLYDCDVTTVFQVAPAVRVALGEEFFMEPGTPVMGKIITAIRKMGGDVVLDTNFTADLTILEEGTELINRIKEGGKLPMMTSCSPGWINFMERNFPEMLDHLSTAKSPQQMFGAVAKTYLAEKMNIDPKKMRVISIMPCTAKKGEAKRAEFYTDGNPDVDVVLTTREFARLLKREGIWLPGLEDGEYDNQWMGEFTGAGAIFGTTGGVMEAALRTVHFVLTGKEIEGIDVKPVRGLEDIKEAELDFGEPYGKVKVAVAHGLKAARNIVKRIKDGTADYTFVEVMACPGGCMSGGGQPRTKGFYQVNREDRQKALYKIDLEMPIRQSHNNPLVKKLYEEFLGEPNSEKAHHLLHTHYKGRKVHKVHTLKKIWEDLSED